MNRPGLLAEVLQHTSEHFALVAISMAVAIALGIPAGILLTRRELQDQSLKLPGARIGLHRGRLEVLATAAKFVRSTEPEERAFPACLEL